jgi:hypothetical protein
MVVLPCATVLANPALPIVATTVLDEVQAAEFVTFWVFESL